MPLLPRVPVYGELVLVKDDTIPLTWRQGRVHNKPKLPKTELIVGLVDNLFPPTVSVDLDDYGVTWCFEEHREVAKDL